MRKPIMPLVSKKSLVSIGVILPLFFALLLSSAASPSFVPLLYAHDTQGGGDVINNPSNRIIAAAIRELGHGEERLDNHGKYIRLYCKGYESPWCAGFVSYVLEKSKVKSFPYYLSAISYYKLAKEKGMLTNKPKKGDLIVFWRKSKNPLVHGHIGIIEKIDNNCIYTIEGNVGKYPAKVKRIAYNKKSIKNLLGFIELQRGR